MRHDLITVKPLQSSFLSCEKDTERLIRTLFVDSQPYSETLKRLLIINEPDCLDKSQYQGVTESYSVRDLRQQGYIITNPRVKNLEHENVKSFIIISFDNFITNRVNEQFKDCNVYIDVVCNIDGWELDDYKLRPIQICGYIDGIFNQYNKDRLKPDSGLTGVGKYTFLSCNEIELNEHLAGYNMLYRAVHFTEDQGDV